jgi:hypothetical protein
MTERGLDFADAARVFEGVTVETEDTRKDYGEMRIICFGRLAAAWLVRYGVAAPDQSQHIRRGVEMKRPSDIFVRAGRDGDKIVNVRVDGYAVQTMDGESIL